MKVVVYMNSSRSHHNLLHAFAAGARAYDEVITTSDESIEGDVAVILWSPKIMPQYSETIIRNRIFNRYKAQNKLVVIIEQPIIRDETRGKFFQLRVGFNDVTRLGEYANLHSPPDRWNALGYQIHDWNTEGTDILIAGQLPGDYSLGGIDINHWIQTTIDKLRKVTDRPLKFKPHPVSNVSSYSNFNIPIVTSVDWTNIWMTVTYSSGIGIDSLINGVPVYAASPRSFAWEAALQDLTYIEWPVRSDQRDQLLYDLAYAQWSEDELKQGTPWSRLRTLL